MIGIVNYGMGNLLSVYHALEMVGEEPVICNQPEEILEADRVVLPGVGAFRDCMENLKNKDFLEPLHEIVFKRCRPFLGICLGMQALGRRSFEGGEHPGLGWIEGDVVKLQPQDPQLRVPHVGWNDVSHRLESPLFEGLPKKTDFYFVHSYTLQCVDEEVVVATCDHGGPVTAAIEKDNLFATQFHPEKSQDYGLKVLENFVRWNP